MSMVESHWLQWPKESEHDKLEQHIPKIPTWRFFHVSSPNAEEKKLSLLSRSPKTKLRGKKLSQLRIRERNTKKIKGGGTVLIKKETVLIGIHLFICKAQWIEEPQFRITRNGEFFKVFSSGSVDFRCCCQQY